MKPLHTEQEFNEAKREDKLACECYHCKNSFYITKHDIQRAKNPNNVTQAKYCSRKCTYYSAITSPIVKCANCSNEFRKAPNQIKKSKSGNHFCSRSCAVTHNNKNKTHGTRRSKLEAWLEGQLTTLYPDLEIHYNRKDAINSELDIYIPSFKLAVELNGIFHYEPIFGEDKLKQIQNNDQRKFQACLENKIELLLVDASQLRYFKPKNAQKYLDIITEVINSKNNLLNS